MWKFFEGKSAVQMQESVIGTQGKFSWEPGANALKNLLMITHSPSEEINKMWLLSKQLYGKDRALKRSMCRAW